MEYVRQEVNSLGALNAELEKIETALANKISVKSDGNRTLEADLDLNSNQILNLPTPTAPTDPIRLQDIPDLIPPSQGANYVGEVAPVSAFNGMRWYNPTIPATFVYYVDGDSGQWVEEASQAVDGGLRDDLADSDSTVLVGGVEAKELSDRFFDNSTTYTVGSGGDYATISAALADLQKKKKRYTSNVQWYVTINLLSGFVMAEQIMLFGGVDLSWIKITSEGRTVVVNTASMTQYLSSEEVPLFSASNSSRLPFLSNIVFSPNGSGSGDAQHSLRSCVCVRQNSSALLDGLTIQNFPGKGIIGEYNATIEAREITSKNNGENLRLRHGSRFHGRSNDSPETTWDFTGGTAFGITIAIDSQAYIRKVNVSGSGIGLYMSDLATSFSCAEITATGCTTSDLSIDGGCLNSETTATFGSVILRRGSNIKCNNLTVTGSLLEVNSDSNVMIYGSYTGAIVSVVSGEFFAQNFTVEGKTGSGVTVSQGGTFTCIGTMVSKSNTVNGILTTTGGIANIQANADLTLNGGSGARANGGTINLGSNANCRKNGTSDQTQDIRVSLGGIIRAVGALGGVFTTANTLTVDGIIFK